MRVAEFYKEIRDEHKAMKIYKDFYIKNRKVLCQILYYFKVKKGYDIALWGAGLKGKAFLRLIDSNQHFVSYVYDIDEEKWNTKMYTGHPIVNYQENPYRDVDVVLVMNNNFETEIAGMLKEANMHVILVNIDSIICGDMTTKEALTMYKGRL